MGASHIDSRHSAWLAERLRTAAEVVKNGESRVIVLNDAAQAIIERVRGRHRRFVFVSPRRRTPLGHLRSTGWHRARIRAAQRNQEWFAMDAPAGFRSVRVHDLRHTFGRRLTGHWGKPRGPAGQPTGSQGTGHHDALQRRRNRSTERSGQSDRRVPRNCHAHLTPDGRKRA